MTTLSTAKKQPAFRDMWPVYQTLFNDHLEATNAAPNTIRTYSIAVDQLGNFLNENGLPTDPRRVSRENRSAWMVHLQRTVEDGGRGLSAQTALQRFQSFRQFFKFLEDAGDIKESPMARLKPPRVPEKLVPVISDDQM